MGKDIIPGLFEFAKDTGKLSARYLAARGKLAVVVALGIGTKEWQNEQRNVLGESGKILSATTGRMVRLIPQVVKKLFEE